MDFKHKSGSGQIRSDAQDGQARPTVFLVIDDEDMLLSQMERILEHAFPACRVLATDSGEDGMRIAQSEPVDLVILDASMPEPDGFEVCRRLKASAGSAHLPVLMISGIKKDTRSKDRAFESGADDYLLKPFTTDDLVFHVKVLLRTRRTEEMLARQKTEVEDELHRRTQQLCERERMYHELVDALPDTVFETDVDLRLRYMNPAGLQAFGYSARDLEQGLSLRRIIVMTARQAEARVRRVLQGMPSEPYEYMVMRQNGERLVARINFSPVCDRQQVVGLRGILIDISGFKQSQHELIESRESYHALFRNMFDAFCLCEMVVNEQGTAMDARFLDVNPAFERMVGRTSPELVGQLFMTVLPGTESYWMELLSRVAITGQTARTLKYFSEVGRYVQLSAFRPRPNHVAVLFQDVTDRKIAEEQAQELREQAAHAEYLQSITALAGTAAHELNNILGPMLCYPDLILLELPEDSSAREDLAIIKHAARRAIEVVEDLATFGRSGMVEKKLLDLNAIVEEYMRGDDVREVRARFPRVEFDLRMTDDLPKIRFNATHVRRIMEAMIYRVYETGRDDAVISIATRTEDLDAPRDTPVRRIAPGRYVVLEVRDSGLVLDRQQIKHLFDLPSRQSHRRVPHGRIGLALAHAAVQHNGGFIDVLSKPPDGSVFRFYFPRTDIVPEASMERPPLLGRGETVLVVDDMATQRNMAGKMITAMGYHVITAPDGATALNLLEERIKSPGAMPPVALVLMDMIMPGRDGLDTFKQMRSLDPGLRCLIVSGYARSDRVREAEASGVLGFVRKPYDWKRLSAAINDAMNAPPPDEKGG